MANAGRLKQIRMVVGLVRKSNPKALPIIFGLGLGVALVLVLVGLLTGMLGFFVPLAVLFGLMAIMISFGRFAQSAQYSAIEGQPGAAAAVLQNMRGNWTVTPAVTGNRNMDVVHRAVGRPGVVLVGEGSPNGLASLLAAEKKRTARVAYEVPVFEFQIGDEKGQVPIRKLQRKVMRLPRNLNSSAVNDLNHRLKALRPTLQAPKGPVPRNGRMPRAPKPRTRLAADHHGVRGPVVQAAQVPVGEQRRDHGEQQQSPDRRPAETDPPAAGADHPDPEQRLAHRDAADDGEQVFLGGEDGQGPPVRPGETIGDQLAQHPVHRQGADPPPHARDRQGPGPGQPEPLTWVVIALRAGAGRAGGTGS